MVLTTQQRHSLLIAKKMDCVLTAAHNHCTDILPLAARETSVTRITCTECLSSKSLTRLQQVGQRCFSVGFAVTRTSSLIQQRPVCGYREGVRASNCSTVWSWSLLLACLRSASFLFGNLGSGLTHPRIPPMLQTIGHSTMVVFSVTDGPCWPHFGWRF